jgi:urease accessory protein
MLARTEPVSAASVRDMHERCARAALHFDVGGGRTILAHQHVPYPFHVTRPFYLDRQRPDLATLYLQSASGGLYRGDKLLIDIDVAPGAAAHVTTQAATVVHDTRAHAAVQSTCLRVGEGAFVAMTPDPLVLFPGAAIESAIDVTLARGACAILSDGFACHDPAGQGRPFARAALATTVRDETGRVLVADRGAIEGAYFLGAVSPAGPHAAVGTLFALGSGAERVAAAELERRLDALRCVAGVTRTPHELGIAIRMLAPDGGTLACGLDLAFAVAFEALLGFTPARRRK